MATDPRRAFIALVVEVPREAEDELAAALGADSLGVVVEPHGAHSTLRVFFGCERDAGPAAARAGAAPGVRAQRLERVEDLRWAERYQAGLTPFAIGTRFLVVPHGGPSESGALVPILLVPGRAFGTGEHETTRLAVAALERRVVPGSRWLDLGTGSGILAVVAWRCGASHVLARDTDPEAVEVAHEVVATNGAAAVVTVERGSAEDLAPAGFDGVVANIAAPYFLGAAPQLVRALRAKGTLLATGILLEQAREVEAALEAAGLAVVERRALGAWVLLAATP